MNVFTNTPDEITENREEADTDEELVTRLTDQADLVTSWCGVEAVLES